MSKLFTLTAGVVLGAATWFLLFVILGIGLGTAFIAGGVVLAAGVIGAGMIAASNGRVILDAPLTSTGLLAGVAAFAVLEIVLSVPMWVGVVTGLGMTGLYDISRAILFPVPRGRHQEPVVDQRPRTAAAVTNGHDRYQGEPAGVR